MASERWGDVELLRRMECAWSEQCGACLNVVNAALPDVLAENARLQALLVERDAEIARLVKVRDVYRDYLLLISRGVWTARNSVESIVWGARKALRDGAALAAASEGE